MIILSRSREAADETETVWEDELAITLAQRFESPVLSIPFLYDLKASGSTVVRLNEIVAQNTGAIAFAAPLPRRASQNMLAKLLDKPIGSDIFGAVFEYRKESQESVDKLIQSLADCSLPQSGAKVERIHEPTSRRWYPVIDTNRCTGCFECVNFCLFGVYVIGENDRPVVDQPDACRDGCPACSRVCPARAIMFPLHEEADIAGYSENVASGNVVPDQDAVQAHHERNDYLDDLVDDIDRLP